MHIVLPGETVSVQHANLKLGPGLQQEVNRDAKSTIWTTRAGDLQHSANGAKWWVENTSARRVCVHSDLLAFFISKYSG